MRKFVGWSLIIFSVVCLLLLVLALLFSLTSDLGIHGAPSLGQELIGSLFSGIIFIVILIYGLRLVKKDTITTTPYTTPFSLHVQGKITYEEYRHLMLSLVMRSPAYLFILICPLILVSAYFANSVDITWALVSVLFVFVLLPVITLSKIKKQYQAAKALHTDISYHITNDFIRAKGNDIDSTSKWTYFIRIKETKQFILLYHSQMVAVTLHKKLFTLKELNEFKAFLQSLPIPKA